MSKIQLGTSDLEELRKRNIADNKLVLAQLMKDLEAIKPKNLQPPKKKQRTYKKRTSDITETRRNPARSARYNPLNVSPPMTRARRASVSSSVSSASGSSGVTSPDHLVVRFDFFGRGADTEDLNTDFDEEEYQEKRRKRPVAIRDERSPDDITEDDLNMVADFVSEKKYDSIYGSTCHQCRQKTNDMKTICRSGDCYGVRGQFCGPCLRNRYGEEVKAALKDATWSCPPCRGICNCSFCRPKQGKSATGILIHLAKERGFSNVNDYLQSLQKKS